MLVEIGGDARTYPIQILIWHEIANDTVGGVPVAVTFCPLCNTAIVFDWRVDTQVLDFGTTGRLRWSNLIMYDRQTESWWQQATGAGIAGEFAGAQLTFLPAAIIAWESFVASHPDGQVLSRETGFSPDAREEAPAAEELEGRAHLGEQGRVAERLAQDGMAELELGKRGHTTRSGVRPAARTEAWTALSTASGMRASRGGCSSERAWLSARGAGVYPQRAWLRQCRPRRVRPGRINLVPRVA